MDLERRGRAWTQRPQGRVPGRGAEGSEPRRRSDAKDPGPGQILRRNRPRRHAPGPVPQQQRQLGQDQLRRRRHRRKARRGVHHGPLRHLHRRQPGHRHPQGPEVHLAKSHRKQLRRRAGQQQAQEAADHAVGAVQRRSLLAPRLRRRDRPTAHARAVRRVHGRHVEQQAREAGGRAFVAQGVRRAVGDEMGRTAADALVKPGQI